MNAPEMIGHVLGVAVQIDDHFLGRPVPDELDVRLDTELAPTLIRGGTSRRHDDGTYRFLDIAEGTHVLRVTSTDARWMTLDPLPSVSVPVAQPTRALRVQAWPTPLQTTPLGMTAVRGKLLGPPAATIARDIAFDIGGADSGFRSRTSSLGEFLFLLPGRLVLDKAGLVPLALRVTGATVTGGALVVGDQRPTFAGAAFRVVPGRETRARFQVT